MKIDAKAKNLYDLESAYVDAPFDFALKELEKKGYRLVSLEENAKLRMLEGIYSPISQDGSWTREDFVHMPNGWVYITKNSPIMENAEEATNWSRKGREFSLNSKQVAYALENAIQIKDTQIPTSRFGEAELTNFCFGKQAKVYGDFLKNIAIDEIFINFCATRDMPYARKVWFTGFGGEDDRSTSDLDGGFNNPLFCLHFIHRTQGVREK
jgi:hypothetical protein